MIRSTRLLLATVLAVFLITSTHYSGAQDVGAVTNSQVACQALVTALPDCASMMYTVCTDGTAPTCGGDLEVSPQQAADTAENGTTAAGPCETIMCATDTNNGTMTDDGGSMMNGTDPGMGGSSNSSTGGKGSDSDSNNGEGGSNTGGSGTSGVAALRRSSSAAVGFLVAVLSAGFSLAM